MNHYIRFFMPLINETKGYEHKKKAPTGRCLLESRHGVGKMIVLVYDLKPEVMYRVMLIFKDGTTYAGLPLATLAVHPEGKAELRHIFNASDIEGYGVSLEECLAVAIVAIGGNDTAAPLTGYRDAVIPWRSGFKKLKKGTEEMTASTASHDLPKGPKHLKEVLEEISDGYEEYDEADEYDEYEEYDENEEYDEYEEADENEATDEEESSYISPSTDPENTLTEKFKEEVNAILKSHTQMQPFQKQNRSVHWVRISLDEDLTLPNYICDLLTEPFVEKSYKKYSHLILGKATDDGPKRYYIGVPALYDPKNKIVGFRQFKCSEDKEPNPGDYGYWLIFMS